jgi:hypothetical protein
MKLPAFHVMAKPTGPICNLDCKYCFYLEKENRYPGERSWAMSDRSREKLSRRLRRRPFFLRNACTCHANPRPARGQLMIEIGRNNPATIAFSLQSFESGVFIGGQWRAD